MRLSDKESQGVTSVRENELPPQTSTPCFRGPSPSYSGLARLLNDEEEVDLGAHSAWCKLWSYVWDDGNDLSFQAVEELLQPDPVFRHLDVESVNPIPRFRVFTPPSALFTF